jgi:chaperonin cofactor prefoldin
MPIGNVLNIISEASDDPGAYLKGELEEGLEPITKRIDTLEKKLDLLILTAQRIETLLKKLESVVNLIKKIPFIK